MIEYLLIFGEAIFVEVPKTNKILKVFYSPWKKVPYRAAACDVICLETVVLPGGKTMKRLYGNGRKFASFLLTSPASVIEHLLY